MTRIGTAVICLGIGALFGVTAGLVSSAEEGPALPEVLPDAVQSAEPAVPVPPEMPVADALPAAPEVVEPRQEDGLLPPMPPRDAFDEIIERPLFSESRRPDVQVNNSEATSASELREQWKLTGIVMVGEELKAMLQQRDGEKHLTLTPGMPLDASWMLEEIHADNVIMGSDGDQVRLDLLEPRDTAPVAKPEPTSAEGAPQEAPNDEVRSLEERAREATRRLQQDIEQTTEATNE